MPLTILDGMADEQPPSAEESGPGDAPAAAAGDASPEDAARDAPAAAAGDAGAGDAGAEGAQAERRTLCRSSTDRVLAGVAGGIGAYFGIDSVMVRIGFVALTFLGGAGPFLYLIGWLALPREDSPSVIANALGGGSQHRFRSLLAVGLMCLGLLITANLSGDLFDLFINVWSIAPYLPLLLIAAGVALVLWPGPTGRHKPTPARPAPAPGAPPTTSAEAPFAATPPTTAGSEWSVAPPSGSPLSGTPPPGSPPSGSPRPGSPPSGTPSSVAVPQSSARPRRGRSLLGSLTVAALFVYTGAAVMLDRLDVIETDIGAFFAIALAITGTGLLVSAFTVPARWLIAVGVGLVPAALLFASVDVTSWRGLGEVRVAPATIDELERDYQHGIGRLLIDLEDLQLDGRDRSVDVSLGMGEVVVYVPERIRFSADIEVGVGAVTERWNYLRSGGSGGWRREVRDSTDGGIGIDARVVLPTVDDSGGELDFDIDVGMGEVEIVMVPSPVRPEDPDR